MISDEQLVVEVLAGNIESFNVIIKRYSKGIISLTTRMSCSTSEAEDLAQETFIKAYKNLKTYNPEYKFSTWIYRIASNTCLDYNKKKKPIPIEQTELNYQLVTNEGPEKSILNKELKRIMILEIDKLPAEFKAVIILNHIHGLSYQDIADILNINLSKVKNRLFKGRNILKERLEFYKGGYG